MIMKPIDELSEILCTAPSVDKDVNELRFGCKIGVGYNNEVHQKIITIFRDIFPNNIITDIYGEEFNENEIEILGNPLSLKHIMMYCNEKGIDLRLESDGDIVTEYENGYKDDSGFAEYSTKTITQLDITKELYEQEDKVLLDIINFLKG